jgi:hypothetical protein
MAAEGRSLGRLGAEAAERSAPGGRSQGAGFKRRQLTWALLYPIGAHDSGCLKGGPFSLNSNLEA